MTWIIHVGIGLVGGIIFSVAYPELAQSVNDSLQPTIQMFGEKISEISIQILKEQILGVKT
jgi:hypothetical protein